MIEDEPVEKLSENENIIKKIKKLEEDMKKGNFIIKIHDKEKQYLKSGTIKQ